MSAELQRVQLVALNPQERLDLFVNLYEALCLYAHVVHGPPNSFPGATSFPPPIIPIAGLDLTLDDIEHGILWGNKRPPMTNVLQQLRPPDPILR